MEQELEAQVKKKLGDIELHGWLSWDKIQFDRIPCDCCRKELNEYGFEVKEFNSRGFDRIVTECGTKKNEHFLVCSSCREEIERPTDSEDWE